MEPNEEEGNALDQCEEDGQNIWPQTLVFSFLTLSTKAPAKQKWVLLLILLCKYVTFNNDTGLLKK